MPNLIHKISFNSTTFLRLGTLLVGMGGLLVGCASRPTVQFHALRLGPGTDVRLALMKAAKDRSWTAASIVSAVGSLKTSHLRFADQKMGVKKEGPFEVVSLSGLMSTKGLHVHAVLSDKNGATLGGHLLEGNIVYTTLEIVILESKDHEFLRELDPATGFNELKINSSTNPATTRSPNP